MARRRFEFKLARLLRVREVAEGEARTAWATAQTAASAAAARRDTLRAELDASRSEAARAQRNAPSSAGALLLTQRVLDVQLAALARANEEAMTREAQAQAARDAWHAAERERRMLAELRERAQTRHRSELAASDQAEMDEIALQRRVRGSSPFATRAGDPHFPARDSSRAG